MRLRVAGGSLKLKHMEGVRFLAISDQLSKLQFHVSAFFIQSLIGNYCVYCRGLPMYLPTTMYPYSSNRLVKLYV